MLGTVNYDGLQGLGREGLLAKKSAGGFYNTRPKQRETIMALKKPKNKKDQVTYV